MLVGDEAAPEAASTRMLLFMAHPESKSPSQHGRDHTQTVGHDKQLQHREMRDGDGGGSLRGQNRTRQSRGKEGGAGRRTPLLRRRLADVENVAFLVPSEGGEDGDAMTGSRQAAAFVNNVADPVSEG